jgi:hypothetical protein
MKSENNVDSRAVYNSPMTDLLTNEEINFGCLSNTVGALRSVDLIKY